MRKLTELCAKMFVLGWMLAASSAPVQADKIVLAADTWCPYNCPSQSKPGIIIEVAREIFSQAGHEVVWHPTPYARALKLVREGWATAVPGAYKTDAPDFIFPQKHVIVSTNHFHVTIDSEWKFRDLSSLSDLSFGIVQDFTFGDPLDEHISQGYASGRVVKISGRMANRRLITMLNAKRIDAVLEDANVFNYWVSKTDFRKQVKTVGRSYSSNSFIAFSPKHPKSREYADIMDKGLTVLTESGRLAQIKRRYGVNDSEHLNCCELKQPMAAR